MLHTKYLSCEPTNSRSQEYHWAMAKEVMKRIVTTSQGFLAAGMIALEEVSPMVLHSTYKAASIYIRVNREIPSKESVQGLEILKNGLRLKNQRWKAAGMSSLLRYR
jgi:hypothetical protein